MIAIHSMPLSDWQRVLCGACLLFWVLMLKVAAFEFSDLDRVLTQAFILALDACFMTQKEAAALMDMSPAHLGKCVRREDNHHLSLNRLVRLPFKFWITFSPILTYIVARKNLNDIAEELGLRETA